MSNTSEEEWTGGGDIVDRSINLVVIICLDILGVLSVKFGGLFQGENECGLS
jgi:hypothetical protein